MLQRSFVSCWTLTGLLVLIAAPPLAQAGTFSTNLITNDADSGISTSIRYFQKVDFNSGGRTINGVFFPNGTQTGANYTLTGSNANVTGHNSPVADGQQLDGMLSDFYYSNDGGNEALTITGLTPGVSYKTSLFVGAGYGFGPGINTQDFSISDTGPATVVLNVPRGGNSSPATRFDYSFVLPVGQTSFTFSIDADSNGDSFHHYGFSTEESAYTLPVGYTSLGGFHNTGVTGVNNPNGTNATQVTNNNTLDTHWQVDLPTAGTSFVNAFTATNQGAYFNGGGNSSYINQQGDAAANSPVGNYIYRTTFNLDANVNLSSVILSGRLYVDDLVTDILINGLSTGISAGGFNEASGKWFVIENNFFLTGLNTLDVLVTNNGVDPNPGALRVDSLRAIAIVPEPATLAMGATGLLFLLALRRKR